MGLGNTVAIDRDVVSGYDTIGGLDVVYLSKTMEDLITMQRAVEERWYPNTENVFSHNCLARILVVYSLYIKIVRTF